MNQDYQFLQIGFLYFVLKNLRAQTSPSLRRHWLTEWALGETSNHPLRMRFPVTMIRERC